jgi:glucans biosynthesis protein
MKRRDLLKLGAELSAALVLARTFLGERVAMAAETTPLGGFPAGETMPFSDEMVVEQARRLSQSPYVPPEDTIPPSYKALTYDAYRAIRFKKELALWKGESLGFIAELFSAGYIYRTPVRLFTVDGSNATEIKYEPELFTYGPEVSPPPQGTGPGFSGFRFHTPINRRIFWMSLRSSRAQVIFARKRRDRIMACRPVALRSIRRNRPRMNFRSSEPSGS